MKLTRLKEIVDLAVNTEPRPEEVEVLINTDVPFITCGARPSVGVKSVGMGFDWESGTLRITPDEKLRAMRHYAPQPVMKWNGKYYCPKCEHMISVAKHSMINFCNFCGTAVKFDD